MFKRRSVDKKGNKTERSLRSRKKKPPKRVASSVGKKSNCESTSAKKLQSNLNNINHDPEFFYCILQFPAVFSAISKCLVGCECGGKVEFLRENIRGLGFRIDIHCKQCNNVLKSVFSSPLINSIYEINRRLGFVMRTLGKGHRGMELFCGLMDLQKPVRDGPFDIIMSKVENATNKVALESMKRAATEELLQTETENKNLEGIIVSGDGTWQKRGFASLFGVSTLIGNYTGKVVDFEVKSAYCKNCEQKKSSLTPAEFEEWYLSHKDICSANHDGSAGKMEVDAVVEMFSRSEDLHNLKYACYVRDGDAKTYSAVVNSKPYADIEVEKKECVGHVRKRMGTRLRKIRKDNKLTGKGKLTMKLIDELTIYYGNAIRNNCNSVKDMKKAIQATLLHKISTNKKPQHKYCPAGKDSWCSWQQAKAEKKLKNYQHKEPLDEEVHKAIQPIYDTLSDEKLLKRCLGGFTQNSNESLNAKIWKIAPKVSPGSQRIVKIASNLAVSTFNDGSLAYLRCMEELGIKIGLNALTYSEKEDTNRLKHARIAAIEATKEARIARRLQNNTKIQQLNMSEGPQYGAGIAE